MWVIQKTSHLPQWTTPTPETWPEKTWLQLLVEMPFPQVHRFSPRRLVQEIREFDGSSLWGNLACEMFASFSPEVILEEFPHQAKVSEITFKIWNWTLITIDNLWQENHSNCCCISLLFMVRLYVEGLKLTTSSSFRRALLNTTTCPTFAMQIRLSMAIISSQRKIFMMLVYLKAIMEQNPLSNSDGTTSFQPTQFSSLYLYRVHCI